MQPIQLLLNKFDAIGGHSGSNIRHTKYDILTKHYFMEQKNYKRTTVTAALPYANGGVHIGHLAGVYVPADIYVRYLRLKNQDVIFIGGSDEHGVPITIRARKE